MVVKNIYGGDVEVKVREVIGIILLLLSSVVWILTTFIAYQRKLIKKSILVYMLLLPIGVIIAMIGIKYEKLLLAIIGIILILLVSISIWHHLR
jgi:hypothetical protein